MRFLSIISLFILFGCNKKPNDIVNLNNNTIYILGHAGSGITSSFPTNSFESIQNAFSIGADGSEMDVQLTKDSVLVLYHNETLEGNTNLSGKIRDLTWSQIQEGQYTVTPYTNYKICSLEDVVKTISDTSALLTLDIKLLPSINETKSEYIYYFASAVVNLINDYNLHNRCYIESQDFDFLQTIRLMDLEIRCFIYPQEFETGLGIAQTLDLYGITISTENITKEQVELAHANNFWVTIWDVHSKKENRDAVLKFPDMIQTDNLSYLIKYLKK